MTKPLFEPSTPREVAGNSWGVSQLLRRPAETGGGAFHGFHFVQSVTGATDQNTYWQPFNYAGAQIWFDQILVDTDNYWADFGGASGGSGAQVQSGLGGFYHVTMRVGLTATAPLVAGNIINLDCGENGQFQQILLEPDMLGSQVNLWFLTASGIFQVDDFDTFIGFLQLGTLTNPGLEQANGIYTRLLGYKVADSPAL